MSVQGAAPRRLPSALLRSVYLRSLLLQASWNGQRMQNLGLLHALLPWLRRSGLTPAEGRRFCRRHYGYFNTNPYYANLVLGGLLRLEATRSAGGDVADEQLRAYKDTLARALAALGDQFFWLGLQPVLLMLACLAAVSGSAGPPLAIVGVFAIFQLAARYRALTLGYTLGLDIADLLAAPGWHRAILTAKRVGALLTGVLAGLYAARLEAWLRSEGDRSLLLSAALALGLSFALRRNWPGELKLLLLLPLALLMTYL